MTFRSHTDRDLIKAHAEANFLNLFEEHGGRRRGKALHCIFHEDKTPSASIHEGRFHCFGCNLSLDPFSFVARAQGTDFRGALAYLADRYGVPLDDRPLSSADRRRWAQEHQRIEEHLLGARYWQREAVRKIGESLALLKAALFDPTLPWPEVNEIYETERILSWLEKLAGAELVSEYLEYSARFPELTAKLTREGRVQEQVDETALRAFLAMLTAEGTRL